MINFLIIRYWISRCI